MIEFIDYPASSTYYIADCDLDEVLLHYITQEQLDETYEVANLHQAYVVRVYVYYNRIEIIWSDNYLDTYMFN